MATIGLISCAKSKRKEAARAGDLYDRSPLFCESRKYVDRCCDDDRWYILSAKHGLLSPSRIIEPYDESLKGKTPAQRRQWAECVWRDLQAKLRPGDRVIVLAPRDYFEFLEPRMKAHGCVVAIPMRKLGLYSRRPWLKEQNARGSCA